MSWTQFTSISNITDVISYIITRWGTRAMHGDCCCCCCELWILLKCEYMLMSRYMQYIRYIITIDNDTRPLFAFFLCVCVLFCFACVFCLFSQSGLLAALGFSCSYFVRYPPTFQLSRFMLVRRDGRLVVLNCPFRRIINRYVYFVSTRCSYVSSVCSVRRTLSFIRWLCLRCLASLRPLVSFLLFPGILRILSWVRVRCSVSSDIISHVC